MSTIDDKIREALRHEDAEMLEHLQSESSLHEMLIETFRGRQRWLNAAAVAWTFLALALSLFAAYRFFQADSTQAMIAWATCFLWFSLWVVMLKMWLWMLVQRLPILREIKRLELKIAELSRQLPVRQ